MKDTEIVKSEAIIVGIAERGSDVPECERSLDELERLLDTAGGSVYARVIQVKDSFDPRTCIGSGKVKEISELCADNCIELVIFDFELTPAQIRNLENDIGGEVRVIDRSMLILDIFALHATSGEGKLQVELAQLRYSAPRLMGHGTELSRLGGGIGTRGPGETKLESDRRHMKEKIVTLERRLAEMEHNRAVMRAQRDRSGLPKIALVGYTNAGKSTLLNALTGAGVLSEDKLFATLDPTTRKLTLPCGENVLLTDTVGFIRKLPHHLVKAFKSTLDEVVYADILLIVSDITDPEVAEHIEVTKNVIEELGASDKPVIYVYNKCDMLEEPITDVDGDSNVILSGVTGEGIDRLLNLIEETIHKFKKKYMLLIPYSNQSVLSSLYDNYTVGNVDYVDEGISVEVILDERGRGMYSAYITSKKV
ncbi:MAG: GTPase HflX [Clostridia bacterium]|nr:GTPase HflX [Clostridia bacterium]